MSRVFDFLAQRREPHRPRFASVVDVAPGGVATVEYAGGNITAQLWDQSAEAVVDDVVVILPIGDTWAVIAIVATP